MENRYDRNVTTVRISEAELSRDVRAVLNQVETGHEVIIEREDHAAIAVIRPPGRSSRPNGEIIREAKERNSTATFDAEFGGDVESAAALHQEPWRPPSWN